MKPLCNFVQKLEIGKSSAELVLLPVTAWLLMGGV
jgi:hypothetical protein